MVKEVNVNELKDGAVLNNRSCTDIICIPIFALFVIGWIVVIAVAISKGNPAYIVLPTNFRGDRCGTLQLTNYTDYFVPIPSHYTFGICVASCPNILDYVCNNDYEAKIGGSGSVMNSYYSHTSVEYATGFAMAQKCKVSCTAAEQALADRYYGLGVKLQQQKCWVATYFSGATLYRCIPFGADRQNQSLAQQANSSLTAISSLADSLGAGSFFTRGFSECNDAWLVILISSLTAAVVATLWILLLRWVLAPITYLCIIAVFALLVIIGYLAYRMADDYQNNMPAGQTGTDNQLVLWKVLYYTAWILAAIYFVVMLWLLKRIRIAIAVMQEASRAFTNNIGMVIIPPITFVLLIGFIALFVVVTLYIQTIGTLSSEDFVSSASSVFGSSAVNLTLAKGSAIYSAIQAQLNSTNATNTTQNITTWTTSNKGLHAYNFFMFLWTANFVMYFGFFILALIVTTWYFSATAVEMDLDNNGVDGGRQKGTGVGTMCKAFCATLRNHIGTILFGSLLIAIIQFIRAVMLYIQKQYLEKYKDNATVKLIAYCINCWLACIERVITIISKNAFIICCITNDNFLSSAAKAVELLVSNGIRAAMLTYLSTISCWLVKVLIVGCNMAIAYGLIKQKSLTNNTTIESGLFPLFFILLISFVIAILFVNVYESAIDTILMCFFVDERDMNGAFMPPTLAKLVGMFTQVAEARKKYEESLKAAEDAQKTPTPVTKA